MSDTVTISPETAVFLSQLLDSVTLSANAPDFEDAARLIVQARRELEGV